MKRRVYFRADAGADIGYGHFIRTLALADMLKDDFDCTFFTCHPTSYQVSEMEKVCSFVILQEGTHYDDFLSYLQGDEIVVLDNYFFTTDYQRAIKHKGCYLVCVDDMHDKHYVSDLVINHALTDSSLFDVEPYTKLCLGFDWALLRKPFLEVVNKHEVRAVKNLLICFGGSDYLNLTQKFINLLLHEGCGIFIRVIIGDKYVVNNRIESLQVEYLHNLSAAEMVNMLTISDLAILPTSGVCLEALACGTPIAAGFFVDNQMKIYDEYLARNLIYPLGDLRSFNREHFDLDNMRRFAILNHVSVPMSSVSTNYIRLFGNSF